MRFDLQSLCIFGAHLPTTLGPAPRPRAVPLEAALDEAVSGALAEARGPIAVALSGGVDSTIVAAALCRAGVKPRAFALDTGRAADEARRTARDLGLQLEVLPLPDGGIRGTPPADVVQALGQPTHSGAPFGFLPLYRALALRGVGTVFTGDGADEAFAGHAYHRTPPTRWHPRIWPTWRAVRDLGVEVTPLLRHRHPSWTESSAAEQVAAEVTRMSDDPIGSARRLRWLDLRLRQGPQCVDLQRALATHCGLIYRAPLADPRVTAAALSLDPRPERSKWPLVELAERWLGQPWRRTKQPMHTPTGGRALDEPWLRWLTPSAVERHGVFRADEVARLVAAVSPSDPWLPRALVVVATTHAGLASGVFARADLGLAGRAPGASADGQFRGASSSK